MGYIFSDYSDYLHTNSPLTFKIKKPKIKNKKQSKKQKPQHGYC